MRLILLRHAKSAWDDAGQDDFDRPLNARGRDAAPRVGAWIAARAAPDHVLVSAAARTRETWDRLGLDGAPVFRDDLYLAPAETIRAALPDAGTVLVVAHNPGIAEAAATLARAAPDHPAWSRYPTGACAILDFDGPATPGGGAVIDFVVPRDLG